ncbi:MAG: hypothetical protein ACI4JC_11465 [Faecalibacterium sp.]
MIQLFWCAKCSEPKSAHPIKIAPDFYGSPSDTGILKASVIPVAAVKRKREGRNPRASFLYENPALEKMLIQ